MRAQQLTQQAQAKLDEGKARAANAERVQLITLKEAQIRPQNTTAVKFKDLDFGSMDAPTPPMGDRNRYTPNPYHPPPTMGDHNRYTPNPYHPPPTMGTIIATPRILTIHRPPGTPARTRGAPPPPRCGG